jgi:hypothetical protein
MERRTAIALLEDRANRVDAALDRFGDTDPKDTPPQILRALCKALGHRLDAVEARLLRPAGQISVREIMEQAKAEAPEAESGEYTPPAAPDLRRWIK